MFRPGFESGLEVHERVRKVRIQEGAGQQIQVAAAPGHAPTRIREPQPVLHALRHAALHGRAACDEAQACVHPEVAVAQI